MCWGLGLVGFIVFWGVLGLGAYRVYRVLGGVGV